MPSGSCGTVANLGLTRELPRENLYRACAEVAIRRNIIFNPPTNSVV
jgi:hypothetical protein